MTVWAVVCRDIYVPVLSLCLLFVQHVHRSFHYQIRFSGIFSCHGCLPACLWQPPLGGERGFGGWTWVQLDSSGPSSVSPTATFMLNLKESFSWTSLQWTNACNPLLLRTSVEYLSHWHPPFRPAVAACGQGRLYMWSAFSALDFPWGRSKPGLNGDPRGALLSKSNSGCNQMHSVASYRWKENLFSRLDIFVF